VPLTVPARTPVPTISMCVLPSAARTLVTTAEVGDPVPAAGAGGDAVIGAAKTSAAVAEARAVSGWMPFMGGSLRMSRRNGSCAAAACGAASAAAATGLGAACHVVRCSDDGSLAFLLQSEGVAERACFVRSLELA
jgi:hypothetical protein